MKKFTSVAYEDKYAAILCCSPVVRICAAKKWKTWDQHFLSEGFQIPTYHLSEQCWNS